MKRNKKFAFFVSSLLCSTLLSAHHIVSKSTDGTGDFLIAPFYEAKDDVCSEIRVFNTNESSSILAKVVFREQRNSHEIDLPIFLSPGDVWSGTVCDEYGSVILSSTDDSNHPKIKDVLKEGKDLTVHSKKAGYDDVNFKRGYVEIYPIAQYDEHTNDKIDKKVLVKRWDELVKANTHDMHLRKMGVDENSLSGMVSFQTNDRETSSLAMIAFKNTHSITRTGTVISYANEASPELLLGKDKKEQLLHILQNDTLSFTYDNFGKEQMLYVSFPFGYKKNQERSFKLTVRDMSENSDIQETIIFSPSKQDVKYTINNELAVVPISKFIDLLNSPKKFKKGLIQLKEITNLGNYQLGAGVNASFIPVVVSTMESREKFINSVINVPVRK